MKFQLKNILAVVAIALAFPSCSSDTDTPKVNELAELIKIKEITNTTHTIELYSHTGALEQGYNVIIDATNLNPKTRAKWEEIASNFDANIEYKEIVIPYKKAIKRDKNRDLQVGEDTIRMFYRKYYPDLLKQELDEI